MVFDSDNHHRRSIRLKGYDYSQNGVYFITINIQNRECLLAKILSGKIVLSNAGEMIQTVWNQMPAYYRGVSVDEFIIMPNHIHGIISIVGAGPCACPISDSKGQILKQEGHKSLDGNDFFDGQPQGVAPTGKMTLSDVVHRFKSLTTKKYVDGVRLLGWNPFNGRLWQRNYYERIIRDENELEKVRLYIINNPTNWHEDEMYV